MSEELLTPNAENAMISEVSTSKFSKFQTHPIHSYIAIVARYYLAWVFISACIHKIQMPEAFAIDIATYQFLPLVFINPLAIVLPYVELGTGVLLLIGFKARAAALMVCGMMCMFMIALSYALMHDLSISCGCFASNAAAASDPISFMTMIRDSAWLLIGLYVVIFDTNPLGLDRILKKRKKSA